MPHHTRCVVRPVQPDSSTARTPASAKSARLQSVPSTMFEVADLVAAHEVDNAFPQPRGRFD